MPKRQPKPEPITPEEVMDSPALQGFDTFLRHRVSEAPPTGSIGARESTERLTTAQAEPHEPEVIPNNEIPIGVIQSGVSSVGILPDGMSQIGDPPDGLPHNGDIQSGETAMGGISGIVEIRPGPKIRRAVKIQDGHSTGEQLVYQALWNAASAETNESRLIRIGYGGLQSLCGLDKTNCKDNIQSLIRKLALEVVSPFSVQRNQGNVYRVFSASAIMKRRKAAGMEWVIRNKGVRFVDSPIGDN